MRPSDIITSAVRDTVRPYLLEQGFFLEGTKFRRSIGEIVQLVEFQRHGVSGSQGSLYLNGFIFVPAIDDLLGRPASPAAGGPHFALFFRPDQIDRDVESPIRVTQTITPAELAFEAKRGLDLILGRMATITTAADAVDYASRQRLTNYQGVFAWYLHQNQLERARAFVAELHGHYGSQPRWNIFAENLDAVAASTSPSTHWRAWIAGQ